MPREAKKDRIHTSSLVVIAMALYSASTNDLETIACFLVFQQTGELPSMMKYPVKDLLERGHPPQLESQIHIVANYSWLIAGCHSMRRLSNNATLVWQHSFAPLRDFA